MGKIDVAQMDFLRNPGHFADIWNGLVFNGKQVIKPDELVEISPVGLADSGDRSVKKTSDMAMGRTVAGEILAVMITENQTEVDYSLPARVHLRECMEYDRQVADICKKNRAAHKKGKKIFADSGEYMYGFRMTDRLRPVTTLILSWNDKEWTGAVSLHDLLDFSGSEDLRNMVADYKMNIVNMDSITNEEDRFANSEVRDVISLYLRRNDKVRFKEYIDEYGEGVNSECMKMLNSFVASNELKKYMDENCGEKGEEKSMCKAITELIQDGKEEGIKQEKMDTFERVTRNYMKQDPSLTREEAERKAKAILS